MEKLTKRQAETLAWIQTFVKENGKPPSYREIGDAFGIASSSVFDMVKSLQRKGHIRRGKGATRIIEPVEQIASRPPENAIEIPVLGRIAAGIPLLATRNIENTIFVDRILARGANLFALKVQGDSMVDEGILDEDLVIVRQQDTADAGDIVVALIEDEATVKKLRFRDDGAIVLVPANPNYTEIIITRPDFRVQGKVVGVVRVLH